MGCSHICTMAIHLWLIYILPFPQSYRLLAHRCGLTTYKAFELFSVDVVDVVLVAWILEFFSFVFLSSTTHSLRFEYVISCWFCILSQWQCYIHRKRAKERPKAIKTNNNLYMCDKMCLAHVTTFPLDIKYLNSLHHTVFMSEIPFLSYISLLRFTMDKNDDEKCSLFIILVIAFLALFDFSRNLS